MEALRKNPFLSGYHWWLFQDYYTSSNGLVDHYFRPKSITKEEVLKVNGEVVLLQDGLERTYRGKDRLDLKLLVSNYSVEPIQGKFIWEVKAGNEVIAKQQVPVSDAPQGEVAEVAHIGLELPETTTPAKLTIMTELLAGNKRFCNDWRSWLYPATIKPGALPVTVFADEAQAKQYPAWGIKPIPKEGDLSSRAVYLIDDLSDNRVIDAMERGACVVLLNGGDRFLKSYPVTFRTTWWKAGENPGSNHTGTLVYDHPAIRAMAPDGWCDDGWFYWIEGGKKYVLETASVRPEVIVRALPSLLMVEDAAMLFEVSVGGGCLIVSGLNHQRAQNRPENEWLIARFLEYAAGFPQPKPKWPVSFLSVAGRNTK